MPTFLSIVRAITIQGWWGVAMLGAACTGPMASAPAVPQWAADSATVRVAAGPQYDRGAAWQFFWGRHYRAWWATPVTVPVLRLATAMPGGLTPLQAGGSYQSRTLRLCAANGREYVLRSVDKDASGALSAGWRRKLLGGLMKDQTSVAQPFGAVSAALLAEAAGVYHANPRLGFLGNDPGLGRFRASHANALYWLEERPDGNQAGLPGFGHSPQVVSTAKLLAQVHTRPAERVEARAYLRARLLDMWLGDWSRREDQWRWASFPQAGQVRYRPIPRDRDQAFFLFDDGLITGLVAWFVPKYQSFHATLKPASVAGLTTTARSLDRTLLASLSAEDYRQEAESLRRRLTDSAITHALAAGPAETRAAITARLGPLLRARREQLPAVARWYYELLAREAWLVGTDAPERFVLSGAGAGRLRVRLLARRPGQPDSLLTERIYNQADTRELSLYGLDGDDILEIVPPLTQQFTVNFYGGAGNNSFVEKAAHGVGEKLLGYVIWRTAPGAALPDRASPYLRRAPDPHPERTADSQAWLTRYNLND